MDLSTMSVAGYTILAALIGAFGYIISYLIQNHGTKQSTNATNTANKLNTYVVANNKLIARNDKQQDMIQNAYQESLSSQQDKITMYYVSNDLADELKRHNLAVPGQDASIMANYAKRLHQDGRNSL